MMEADTDLNDETTLRPIASEALIAGIMELAKMRATLDPRPTLRLAASVGHRVHVLLLGGI